MQQSDLHDFRPEHPARTVSEILRADIDEFVNRFRQSNRLLRRAQNGELSQNTFGLYLRSIHYLLKHTPIHLSLAEERAKQLGYDELASFFAHKRTEEEGHDRWAEADISGLTLRFGVTVPDQASPCMVALVDANADMAMHDPFLYLAYVFFAEYFIVRTGAEWVSALSENCGIPASIVSAVGNHVELDKAHVKNACTELDALVGSDRVDPLRRALCGMMDRLSAFSEELGNGNC